MVLTAERRAEERRAVARPCKVFRRSTLRFVAARTVNCSRQGVLLDLAEERPFTLGETVEIAVAWSPRPLLEAASLIPATVVRVGPASGEGQRIALRLAEPAEAVAAA